MIGYALVCRGGHFDLHSTGQVAVAGAGALLMRLGTARHSGRFHGGNAPGDS